MDFSAFMTVVLVFAAWFILVRWILPWLGVPTCCCSCSAESHARLPIKRRVRRRIQRNPHASMMPRRDFLKWYLAFGDKQSIN